MVAAVEAVGAVVAAVEARAEAGAAAVKTVAPAAEWTCRATRWRLRGGNGKVWGLFVAEVIHFIPCGWLLVVRLLKLCF